MARIKEEAATKRRTKERRGGPPFATPTDTNVKLWKHVEELATSSALLLFLASVGSERLSLTQAAFFLTAATADAAGRPTTRTALLNDALEGAQGSIRNSYRQLLEPSRNYPKALGWLTTEDNPMDEREKLLRLTDEGKRVISGVLLSLEPILSRANKTNGGSKH